MAGRLPSFLNSARLVIRIGDTTIAYATSLNFSDDMANVPVGGIGSFNFHTNEPVSYLGRGSMVITQYSDKVYNVLKANNVKGLPSNLTADKQNSTEDGVVATTARDGNSMLIKEYFSPIALLTQRSFDIAVYERNGAGEIANLNATASKVGALYFLKDCRMTSYNLSFTPGQLLSEAVTFLCLSVLDSQAEQASKLISYKED
jgi:hypothetical protein